jgi:Fe-S oxidoreductase
MDDTQKQELVQIIGRKLTQAVRLYLEGCARCGVCVEACHVYASMPEARYTAVGRAQNVRRLFERYFTTTGKLLPWLQESVEFSDEWMHKVYETAYTCTGCRRCMILCPFGVDTGQLQAIAKELLIAMDMEPKILSMLTDMSVAKGENIEATKGYFSTQMKSLEQEVVERWRTEAKDQTIPLDNPDADVLYVALAGKHSIVPAAAILNAAKVRWSLSYFEAVNFGAFVGNAKKTKEIAGRIIEEAKRLEIKEVAVCECGTAYRVLKHMIGDQPFQVVTFAELIDRYLRDGRIKVDKAKLQGKVTYHDPCQIARQGGVYDEPRDVIRRLTDDFVDLVPTRELNWCCGGGGGLVAMGEKDFRMKSGKVKADQVRSSDADVLVTACENCHTQLHDLMEHHKVKARVEFLSAVVAEALVLD